MAELLTLAELKARDETKENAILRRIAKRDHLYFNFRYSKNSYKARKMGLQPILMMAKRGNDKIRIYGETDETIEPKKLQFAMARFKAWGQKERELKKLQKRRKCQK